MIITVIYSMTVYSQNFVHFDEMERNGTKIYIAPKGQKKFFYKGGMFIVNDNPGFFKKTANEFFKIFRNIDSKDQEILQHMRIELRVSNNFKAENVEIVFDMEDRAYVLQNEELFYQLVKSFENMNKYRSYIYCEETASGGFISFPVKTLFKEEYKP